METLTTCSICYCKYSHDSHIPLVLACGHTYCNHCVSKMSKCPSCRTQITSTATNFIIFQFSNQIGPKCDHKFKKFFCPTCSLTLCISCVSLHNTHGIVPLNDAALKLSIKDKLQAAQEKLKDVNYRISLDLKELYDLKNFLCTQQFKVIDKTKRKFEEIINFLNYRKGEILDEIESFYKPISSKIDTLLKGHEETSECNQKEIEFIDKIKIYKIKKQIELIRPFKAKHINHNLLQKISKKLENLPKVKINTTNIMKSIESLGRLESERKFNIFGLFFKSKN